MTTTPAPNVGENGFADWSPELLGELAAANDPLPIAEAARA